MYSVRHHLTIGFHGCDKEVVDLVVNQKEKFKHSSNRYDWLGHGFYFWEQSQDRAIEFAQYAKDHPDFTKGTIKNPAVLGAVIELGNCLDLLDAKSIPILKAGYKTLELVNEAAGAAIPTNKPTGKHDFDNMLRLLDCAVIETIHNTNAQNEVLPYDSIRAAFITGEPAYPDGGFKDKNHIHLCIRNINCIKGFFIPRLEETDGFSHFKK